MNGVGFKLSGRISVPKEPLGYPPRVSSFKICFVISKIDTMISQNRLSDMSQSRFCDVRTSYYFCHISNPAFDITKGILV